MTRAAMIEPWQVWLADFGSPAGSEQGGTRPAVIVGSEDHCRFPIQMALVVPLTARDRGLPHHIAISSTESGLKQPSWARPDDIRAISTTTLHPDCAVPRNVSRRLMESPPRGGDLDS